MNNIKNSANQLLHQVYQGPGYQDGTLLDAVEIPMPGSKEAEHWLEKGASLSAIELRNILHKQIRGIEINSGAIYVAAFSLYLALFQYQNPPDILAQIEISKSDTRPLPHLIFADNHLKDSNYYHILFNINTFALMNNERIKLKDGLNACETN